ncbi:MAG TPA: hypothetical protein VFE51_02155 [Verrucomicrobiae bacterium]|nr:hypothetical protein [Verrucomicrobiae bacterium]
MSPGIQKLPPTPQQLAMAQLRRSKPWEIAFRIINFSLILGSLGLAWWTFSKRMVPMQKRSREAAVSLDSLSTEVDNLARKWPRFEVEQIRSDYKEVRNELFADELELGRWLVRLEEQASPLALDIKVDFGKSTTRSAENEKLAVIPASVTLVVRPTVGGNQTPYQRMLRLGQQLGAEGKRADLAELTVNGGPLSITKGVLVFNLWAGEESPDAQKH